VIGIKRSFPGWWKNSSIDPDLSMALLLLIAQKYSAYGLLADDAMSFIGELVKVLKRKHYQPGGEE
jgi:type I restriction enzyme, R subunit